MTNTNRHAVVPNAGRQLLPEAGATQERALEAVSCTPRLWGISVPPQICFRPSPACLERQYSCAFLFTLRLSRCGIGCGTRELSGRIVLRSRVR